MEKKVLLVVAAEGYQPVEYGATKEILEANNIEVVTASDGAGQAYASDGSVTHVDLVLAQIDTSIFDGIFIIGGPGAMEHLDKADLYNVLRTAEREEILYGAICISPRILARAGVLTGKKATSWNEDSEVEELFKKHDVTYQADSVVRDGNVITADGPSSAKVFGEAIVDALK